MGGPVYAEQAKAAVQEWASDPEAQARAYYMAGLAGRYLGSAGNSAISLIEQGPVGVRLLAFSGGCISCAYAVLFCTSLGDFFANMSGFLVSNYQLIFSLTTVVFEAPSWVI